MVERMVTILLSALPIVAIFIYVYRMDRNRESRSALAWTFLLGFLCIVPVLILALVLAPLGLGAQSALAMTLFVAFMLAAVPEETAKLLVIRLYCAHHRSFDEPMDGLVYGATAALGFAVLEHLMYITTNGLAVGPFRAFLCVPAHAALGAIIGYSISRRAFVPETRARTWKGWAAAVLLHGLYDAFWLYPNYRAATGSPSPVWKELGPILAVALTIGLIAWSVRTFRREREAQDLAADGGPPTTVAGPLPRVERLRSTDIAPRAAATEGTPEGERGETTVDDVATSSDPSTRL